MEIIKTNKTWTPQRKEIRQYYEFDAITEEKAVPKWWNYDNHCLIEGATIGGAKGYKKFCKAHKIEMSEKGCPILGCNHK